LPDLTALTDNGGTRANDTFRSAAGTSVNRVRAYLELLRPPNVATALADVLAGYAVSGLQHPRALPWLLLSTAALYGGGVVLNDVFDREVDRAERPERPLPSGRASVGGAATLGGLLLIAGVLSATRVTRAAAFIALTIAVLVVVYDAWGKRHAVVAPFNMGLCRALNLLLGVAAAPPALRDAWPLAGIPLFYIGAVTALSRGEVHGGRREIAAGALLSLTLGLVGLAIVGLRAGSRAPLALGMALVLAWRIVPPFWRAYRAPDPATIRAAVKRGVLSLVLVDAAIAAAYGGVAYSLIILATALLAAWLARLFAVT
jgi:4-hydroxybenzoate polyprenyltransferase